MVFVPWAEFFFFTFGGRALSSDTFVTFVALVWYMYGTCSDCPARWTVERGQPGQPMVNSKVLMGFLPFYALCAPRL